MANGTNHVVLEGSIEVPELDILYINYCVNHVQTSERIYRRVNGENVSMKLLLKRLGNHFYTMYAILASGHL